MHKLLLLLVAYLLPALALAGPALNEDDHIQTLQGVDAASVWIEGIDRDAASIGLSEPDLRMVVEPALRTLGIRTLTREQAMARADVPVFTVFVSASRNVVDTSYALTLEYRQIVYTESKQRVHVPTWSIGSQGMARNVSASDQITSVIKEGMQRFARDLRKAQPFR